MRRKRRLRSSGRAPRSPTSRRPGATRRRSTSCAVSRPTSRRCTWVTRAPRGRAASLLLLRDLALGRYPEILDKITLVILPIYNVDGHERISPYNRPNQDGPHRGMGFRTTAAGLDLNRDYVKVVSPEAQ